jgi:hypothetical protein
MEEKRKENLFLPIIAVIISGGPQDANKINRARHCQSASVQATIRL